MIHMDQCTPIQLMANPAKAGPKTDAICQVELLHVAAFGYIFLGTNKAISENIVGPIKALTNPPKKINA